MYVSYVQHKNLIPQQTNGYCISNYLGCTNLGSLKLIMVTNYIKEIGNLWMTHYFKALCVGLMRGMLICNNCLSITLCYLHPSMFIWNTWWKLNKVCGKYVWSFLCLDIYKWVVWHDLELTTDTKKTRAMMIGLCAQWLHCLEHFTAPIYVIGT